MTEQTNFTPKRVKLMSAIVGGSAVVIMGALTVALGGHPKMNPSFEGMKMGTTVTQVAPTTSAPDSVLATAHAEPTLKATRPKGF